VKFTPHNKVDVFFNDGNAKKILGTLALNQRKIFFEYSAEFVRTGLPISPIKLPLQHGVFSSEDATFDGLFGVFNDSLPDGWARLLLDRKLASLGVSPKSLTPLDRLCFVGNNGMGALSYKPSYSKAHVNLNIDLDNIAAEIHHFQENDSTKYVEELLSLGGSSLGARPKILLRHNNADWMVKFGSSLDPKDIGNIEYAYYLMAKAAKLDISKSKLFPSKKGPGFFGTQRFDRNVENLVHIHTASGLLHADHRFPCLDYSDILKATMYISKDIQECKKQFRNAAFNILSHNRDDHAKNFSFIMDQSGAWKISPAYDLTFSSGPGGEHCTTILGEGKTPTTKHLLDLAKMVNIKTDEADNIISDIIKAIANWPHHAEKAGVSSTSKKLIQNALNKIK
jgi:serine/threonine-protein kinase HipA